MDPEKIPDIVIGRLPIYLRALTRMLNSETADGDEPQIEAPTSMATADLNARLDLDELDELDELLEQRELDSLDAEVDGPPGTEPAKKPPTITSEKLGKMLGISPAQIRKDLSHFDRDVIEGIKGIQGSGYRIKTLVKALKEILKVDREWKVALVGAGAIGTALLHYGGFLDRGFRIAVVFDSDPAKIGTVINGYEVQDMARIGELISEQQISLAMLAVPADAAQRVADNLIAAGVRGILNYAPINLAYPAGVHVQPIDPVVHMQRITYYL